MPFLNNPTDYPLTCAVLHLIVPARSSVEISGEQAELVNSPILTVTDTDASNMAAAVAEVAAGSEAEDDGGTGQGPAPTRKQAPRGSKQAEITTAPAAETR